jgi:hypothetical protein
MAKIQELKNFKLSDAVKFNDTLNPAIWQDEKLKPEVREQLEKIARHFAEYLGISDLKIEDITISGSNAAFTWTPHSDLDLHLLVDFSKLPNSEVYQELFNAKKILYNNDHNITVKGLPVELYVQDTNQKHYSMGEYSILKDDWIHIPKKEKPNFDESATKLKYEKLGNLIELALKTKNLDKVNNVLSIIKRYRKSGLSKTGEFGPENLAFKAVRKQGLVQKLFDLKKKLESKHLSIDEQQLNETIEESEIVNMLAEYATMDILRLIKTKDPGFLNYLIGKTDSQEKKYKLMTFEMDFLKLRLPKISNKNFLEMLKNLKITINYDGKKIDKKHPYSFGLYRTLRQEIVINLDNIKKYALEQSSGISLVSKLAETIGHEIQHHIDNVKSGGKAFNKPKTTNQKEYLRLPYEVNARMQEAFYDMGFYIDYCKRKNKLPSSHELQKNILDILYFHKLDDIYSKNQKEYKQLVKRLYKFADKLLKSPITITPATFAQKVKAFITGKHDLGTINEDQGFRYYKNPTPKQLYNLTEKSKNKHMRGIYYNGKTYWWDAYDAIHKTGAEKIGVPYDYSNCLEANIGVASGKYSVIGAESIPNEVIQKYNFQNELINETSNKNQNFVLQLIQKVKSSFPENSLFGGNCGTFALALATILKENNIDTKIVVICEDVFEEEADIEDIETSDVSVYHVAVKVDGALFDGDGKVTGDSIADWIEEEYYDYSPAVFTFELSEPGLRRLIENNTNWSISTAQFYKVLLRFLLKESSGYIPSSKEKNDPRFKTALSVDVTPQSIKKNARAFNWNISRSGVPPKARVNGKII